MDATKVRAYYGFAKKNGTAKFGIDSIIQSRGVNLVVVSSKLSLNSKQKIESFCNTKHIKLFELQDEDYVQIEENTRILAFAVADKSLAQAIIINIS